MKIAIAKPDYKVMGGFEIVLDRIAKGLVNKGHQVDYALVDATESFVSHLPKEVTEVAVSDFRDFFFHANMVLRFEELDLADYDAVLCTQPGSYAVRHPRKVALFYHHLRAFYDMMEVMQATGSHNDDLLRLASQVTRDIDRVFLTRSLPILAGSQRVKERLAQFNGLDENVSVFYCGIDEAFMDYSGPVRFESPLCVGRHEFPKRTELFLHAMKHIEGLGGRVLGTGSQTDRLQGMDAYLQATHLEPGCPMDDRKLCLDHIFFMPLEIFAEARETLTVRGALSNVEFLGRVSHEALVAEYANALCVVCPAYDEDFGLTCVEAMAVGKPVIACKDGGGYVELIEDGVDGFLVDPTGQEIAKAISKLRDRDLARRMGEAGREKARQFTWSRAIDQVEQALQGVLATSHR